MPDEIDSIEDLRTRLRHFSSERDWDQFHGPRNLLLALTGEIGELCSLVQWVPDADVPSWSKVSENHAALRNEMADVLLYLVQLADAFDIDLYKAAVQKMNGNSLRYSVENAKGNSLKQPHAKAKDES